MHATAWCVFVAWHLADDDAGTNVDSSVNAEGATLSLPEYLYQVYSSPMSRNRKKWAPSTLHKQFDSSSSLTDNEYFSANSRAGSLYSLKGYESSMSSLTDGEYLDAKSTTSTRYDSSTSLTDGEYVDAASSLHHARGFTSSSSLTDGEYADAQSMTSFHHLRSVSQSSLSSCTDGEYATAASGGSETDTEPSSGSECNYKYTLQAHAEAGSLTNLTISCVIFFTISDLYCPVCLKPMFS